MAWKVSCWPGKFPVGLEDLRLAWKVSGWPRNIPDNLESFQITWKLSSWPEKFPDGLKTFQVAWKPCIQPEKFPHGLENFLMPGKCLQVWKITRFVGHFYAICPGKFPDDLKSAPSIWQVFTLLRLFSLCLINLFQNKKKELQKLSRQHCYLASLVFPPLQPTKTKTASHQEQRPQINSDQSLITSDQYSG